MNILESLNDLYKNEIYKDDFEKILIFFPETSNSSDEEKIKHILEYWNESQHDEYEKKTLKYKNILSFMNKNIYFPSFKSFYGYQDKKKSYLIEIYREFLNNFVKNIFRPPITETPQITDVISNSIEILRNIIREELEYQSQSLNKYLENRNQVNQKLVEEFENEINELEIIYKNERDFINFIIRELYKIQFNKHMLEQKYMNHVGIYENTKNLLDLINSNNEFIKLKNDKEKKLNELENLLIIDKEKNQIKSFIQLLNHHKNNNIIEAYMNLDQNGYKIFDYLTNNNFVNFTYIKKFKNNNDNIQIPLFIFSKKNTYYTIDDFNDLPDDDKYNFYFKLIFMLKLQDKYKLFVEYYQEKKVFAKTNIENSLLQEILENINLFEHFLKKLNDKFKILIKDAILNKKSLLIKLIIIDSKMDIAHANAISVHKGRVEIFESVINLDFLQNRFNKVEAYFNYIISDLGPIFSKNKNISNISFKWNYEAVQHMEFYCSAYSSFFLLLRIIYPELSFEEIYYMNISLFDAQFDFDSYKIDYTKYDLMSSVFEPVNHNVIVNRIENFIILMDEFNKMYEKDIDVNFEEFLRKASTYIDHKIK